MLRFLLIVLCLFVSLDAKVFTRMQVIMSTFVTISTQERYKEEVEKGFNILKDVELSLSSYNPNAIVYRLNENREVKLDSYSYEALKLCEKYYKQTNGYFDITIGSITKDLYRFGEKQRLVSVDEFKNAKVGFDRLEFNEKKAFLSDGVKIDLGGMGKGFGVDKAADYFRNKNIDSATISASGDIRCLDICKIDVQDPFSENILLSFETTKKDLGISTSGTYNRYVINQKNNHLIDPKSKRSQTKFVSITLVGDILNADLDAYATAASVMPKNEAYTFLESLNVAYIVVQSDGVLKSGGNLSLIVSDAIKK